MGACKAGAKAKLRSAPARNHLPEVQPLGNGAEFYRWSSASNPTGTNLVSGLSEDDKSELLGVLDGMLLERRWRGDAAVPENQIHVGVDRE